MSDIIPPVLVCKEEGAVATLADQNLTLDTGDVDYQ